jgi:2,4-didehydro-3-deoxy-L-rhamnonate hydrolase
VVFGIVSYAVGEGARIGVMVNDQVADAEEALTLVTGGRSDMRAVLASWDDALPRLAALADAAASGKVATRPASEVRLLAPVAHPTNLYCAFANYVDHMHEMGGQPADKTVEDPYVFQVPATAVSGPGDPIIIPPGMDRTDWEGELAAVIGQTARDLSVDDALSCVAGYTIVHDVSIRGGARRGANGGRPDFLASKGRATFKPMGPSIIPAQFIPDPQALRLRTWVSGELKQDSSTAQMIFTTAELISWLSRLSGLVPGDVIATGTPAGVGMPKGTFLKPGDTVEIEIEGIGRLSNPVVGG